MSKQFSKLWKKGIQNNLLVRRITCKKYQYGRNHNGKWFSPKYEYQIHGRRGKNLFMDCISYSYSLRELNQEINQEINKRSK